MVREKTMETVSVRISPGLKKEFEEFVLDFNTAHAFPGTSVGVPQLITVTRAYRVALEQGLAVMRKGLQQKRGRR